MNKFKLKNRRHFIICLICSLLMFGPMQAQTSMFGANPQHSGFYNSHFRPDIKLVKKWSFKTGGKIFSTASISDNTIFIGSDDSCLYAVSTDGNLKWKFKSSGMVRSAPAVKDTIVYFNNYDSMFYAIGVKSGKEIWSYKTEGESVHKDYGICGYNPRDKILDDIWDVYQSSPVINDSIIYFGSGKNMYAFNLNTKSLLWSYKAGNIIHSTPAVANGAVFFGCWDSKLYSLDALSGEKKWIFATGTDPSIHLMEGIASSPSVVDTIVYIGSRDGNVYAINTKNGKQIWKTGFSGSWMPSSFAVSKDSLYTGSSDAKCFYGLNRLTGGNFFTTSTNCYNFSSPAITSETGFIGCMNGSLYAFNRLTGRVLTRFDTDARIRNKPYAVKDDGSLNSYYFDPVSTGEYTDALEFMKRLYSTGCILSTPVIDKEVVYFGSTDSCLYAVFDDGTCRPNIYFKTGIFDLGTISQEINTSFYVRNYGDCLDSVNVAMVNPTYLKSAVIIDQPNFNVDPGDSVKVNVKISCNGLKAKNFQIIVAIYSKSNRYKIFSATYNFKVVTEVSSIELEKKIQSFPNPFSETTTIKFNISEKNSLKIFICNLSGQKVKNLTPAVKESGEYIVTWDGKNDSGIKMPSGLYIVCLEDGGSITNSLITIQK